MVRTGAHRIRKAALEEAVDLSHLAPSGNFSVHGAESGQHILAEIPECFKIAGETNALRDSLNRMATMDLQQ